ncbi:restriction endonuclease subunit S [Paenibacillus sp. GYB004]|uniref:restriction endonuclease subunit S n=1 Tax=Paenibacillus sp. GYB004 TaxID=2994393 RepID=UPI002F963594
MMLDDLFPYSEYKDSGLPYYGQIPTHWKVLRNGQIFSQRNQTGFPDLPILEVSLKTGVQVRDFENSKRKQIMNDREKYKRAAKGDIAYNMMRMWQGAVGVAPVNGLISPAYVVASPFPGVDSRYYSYLFRTQNYMNEVNKYSRGIVSDRNRLYWDQFKQMPSLFPPSIEQKKIADFLDNHGRKVSRLIRIKKRQVRLFSELKQAIIKKAVTRGINSEIQLKSSGIDWIGDIPEHWTIKRVKTEFICLNYKRIPLSSAERGLMKVREFDYYGASGVIDKVDEYIFDDELILLAEDGANLVMRNLKLAIIAKGKFWVNNHAHILKPINGNIDFLAHLLESIDYRPWISGAAQPKLTKDRLMGISIAVPSKDEQDAIASFIENETRNLDIAIQTTLQEIELITEYRTRLISDVVTGQIDARNFEIDYLIAEDTGNDEVEENDIDIDNDEVPDLEECEV